jgi:hypothetical protein
VCVVFFSTLRVLDVNSLLIDGTMCFVLEFQEQSVQYICKKCSYTAFVPLLVLRSEQNKSLALLTMILATRR